MKKHKHLFKTIIIVFLVLLVCFSIYAVATYYSSKNYIELTTYEYPSEQVDKPVNIVVLSDVHAHEFGKNNKVLLQKVKDANPDVILAAGDIINFYEESPDFLFQLIAQLKDIAPTYYSVGNHEVEFMSSKQMDLQNGVESAGGIYLDQEYVDIDVNGQALRIGGLYDYSFNYAQVPEEQYLQKSSYLFLQDFENSNRFKIMMSHRPESFITKADNAKWAIDLVVSGHEHGGQIRLPFIGGFYSTHLGLFSEFLDNYHVVNGVAMVISRGLGTHEHNVPPRLNNIPEIVCITIK